MARSFLFTGFFVIILRYRHHDVLDLLMKLLPSDLRNSFGSSLFNVSFLTSSLVDIQKKSYFNFLHDSDSASPSISEVLRSSFPVKDAFGSAVLEFVSCRVAGPKLTVAECRKKATTYSTDIYVTVRFLLFDVDQATGMRKPRNIKEQELLLCSMPMMTDNATFMINGFERVVVSQIYRSPGVFFAREAIEGNVVYSASIMPYRGSRLDIILDQRGQLLFSISQKKKLPIYYLLVAMQMDARSILHYFHDRLSLRYDSALDLWKMELHLTNILGKRAIFSILSSAGEVLVVKGVIINQQYLSILQDQKDLYCSTSDLPYSILMEDVIAEGEPIWGAGTVMTESILGTAIANGLHDICIIDFFSKSPFSPIANTVLSCANISYEVVMEAILKILYPSELFTIVGAKQRFVNTFFNPAYYSLFAVGRYKLNTALGLDIPEDVNVLRHEDILLTIKKLLDIKESLSSVDDIDSLVNRRVRSVGELLENQLRINLSRVTRNSVEKLNTLNVVTLDTSLPEDLIVFTPITRAIREFFATSQLSQFMDQTNPLAELAHKRRISSLGAGGLSRDRAGIEVRDVHNTHYGRVCPIETPEGQNIGLISSLATYATINRYGFIETPYRKIVNRTLTDEIIFLDAIRDSDYVIGQADASIISDGKIIKDVVSARKAGESTMIDSNEVQMMDISPKQTVSVVASLIPFLENDDAKRSLMGSNMQRQAVPLIVTEAPLIGAGMERAMTADSGVLVIARRAGIVTKSDAQHVMIRAFNDDGSLSCEIDDYVLRKFKRSNQNTCINQVVLVKKGDRVDVGDIIADGPATSLGEIALGKNLLLAFMPWCGYNFEDSIIISESVIHGDVFTSIHIEEFELVARDTRLGAEEVTVNIPNASEESLRYLDEAGIVHLGANVTTGDVLVGKITPRSGVPVAPEEKLLQSIFEQEIADVNDSSLRMPPGMSGTVVDVNILTRRDNEKDARAKYIEQQELIALDNLYKTKLSLLDSFFLPEVDELLLGKKVLYSLHGKKISFDSISLEQLAKYSIKEKFNFQCDDVVSERLTSLKSQYDDLCVKSKRDYAQDIDKIMYGDDLQPGVLKIVKVFVAMKSKLQPGDKMAGRHGNKGIVAKIVPVEDMPFMKDGTPVDIILNPLGVPGRINIGQIMETHLGFVSYLMGRKIDQYLKTATSLAEIRNFLDTCLTDTRLKDRLKSMSDDEFADVASFYRKGVPFATPVFEGAKVSDIEQLLESVNGDKSGQITLYDGRTGIPFDRKITVGCMYMMKLHHLASNKIHARSTGPYSLVTQQPLGGKSHFGGQRFGEMECWALQAYGAAYTLQEMLTVKSDDVDGRVAMYASIVKGEAKFTCGIPESFNVLLKEMRALCLKVVLENK